MPIPSGLTSPDARIMTLRRIASGEVLPADDPVAANLGRHGHVEHDGGTWQLTEQGSEALAHVTGQPAAPRSDDTRGHE